MKKVLLFALFFLNAFALSAQVKRDSILRNILSDSNYCNYLDKNFKQKYKPADSLYKKFKAIEDVKKRFHYTDYQYITTYSMNRLIRQDLTKITLNEDGMPSVGNYATIKYSEDNSKITLNTSWYNPFYKSSENDPIKNILSINIKAGVTDGIASLFADKNLNSGVGIKAKMTFLTRNTFYEGASIYGCNTLALYRTRLLDNYNLEYQKFYLDSLLRMEKFRKQVSELRQTLSKDQQRTNEVGSTLNDFNEADSVNFKKKFAAFSGKRFEEVSNIPVAEIKSRMILLLTGMTIHNDSTGLALTQNRQEYNNYMAKSRSYSSEGMIDAYYKQLLDLETRNVKWRRFSIEYWNVDVSISGEKYNVFNSLLPVKDQLSKQSFTNWSVGTSFNRFMSNSSKGLVKNGFLYKIGYSLSNNNNFIGAKTQSITNTVNIDTPSFRREVVDKVDAYAGPFKKFYAHTLSAQATKYINEKKSNALSLYSSVILNFDDLKNPVKIKDKPYWTTGTGYTLSLLDKEKEKAVINFELYFNFYDLLNSAEDKETRFYQRRELGIKIGVPFSSIFLN
ncbi:hypothetical protein [Mucilaginibacter phyllosphaerae]|uniref:Uncharacterized protein n=1 Tax=Mucilaginibacter phyllosphaerae TaxID=1812349 RepID=A0A4Y8AFC2_9SPHI|nr:hypothetical protein [Mucilaginibacter phyllosphaerae]MBB3968894.1 hypothetical protein [Mucilaginibacter phyllosphaerae]TEW67477.1 hypothetical protein E2R65_05680 [Mucilaginibacter phyllosphaerae]